MPEPSFLRPEPLLRNLGVTAGETFVHLGCGAGFYVIPAAVIVGDKGSVIGVDILPHLLSETLSRAVAAGVEKRVRTIRANLETPKGSTIPAASADWVLLANVLHQADPTKMLAEAARICKPTGTVAVVEWEGAASPFGPPTKQRVPKRTVLKVAEAAGLQLKDEFSPSQYHYGLLLCPPAG